MMVENCDIDSFRKCCSWWISGQAVPSQPAWIPAPSQASACEQISLFAGEMEIFKPLLRGGPF